MALVRHLEEAADKLKQASTQLEEARAKPVSVEHLHEWLTALTDYSLALSDLHDLNMEAVQEKLDDMAGRQRQSGDD